MCANITQFNDPYYTNYQNDCLSHISDDIRNDLLFANLRSFEFRYSNGNHNNFEIFAQNYKNKFKSIKVFTDYSYDTNSFAIVMQCLSQMLALIDLQVMDEYNGLEMRPKFADQLEKVVSIVLNLRDFDFILIGSIVR